MKLYAYHSPDIPKHDGYLKIGETYRSTNKRISQQSSEANVENVPVWEGAIATEQRNIDRKFRHFLRDRYGFHIQPRSSGHGESEWVNCTVDDIKEAFPKFKELFFQEHEERQKFTNEFYKEIRNWFYWTKQENQSIDDNYTLRLVIRLLFCVFLRDKNKLVPEELLKADIQNYLNKDEEYSYYNGILRNLFFRCLNTQGKREYINDTLFTDKKSVKGWFATIPFLNGGLFDEHEKDKIPIGNDYFFSDRKERMLTELDETCEVYGIITILSKYQYKLTLDDLLEQAEYKTVDPEFIGKVFESLLSCIDSGNAESRRKITGSYYTPREIVNYMVNASLDAYLESKRQTDTKASDTELLLQCKILDPACGSGAFPCEAMNIIMHRIEEEKKEQTNRNLTPQERYSTKLDIVRNVIYGVDIQPMAVQISQLRFFLSLVQEISPNNQGKSNNYDILPLPNLETKFVCADALVGLKNGGQGRLEDPVVKDNIKKLRDNRNRFFMANSVQLKKSFRDVDETLRSILVKAMEGSLTQDTTKKLVKWNPYEQTKAAEFFDPTWMFGEENFDIVVGNPPYLKQEYFSQKQKDLYYHEFRYHADMYVYFIFAGFNLVKNRGTLCYIANDSFLGFKNTKNVRELFFDNDLRQITPCGKIFDDADIYTAIFLLLKQANEGRRYETEVYKKEEKTFFRKGKVNYTLSQNLVHQRLVVNSPIAALFCRFLDFGKMHDFCSVLDTGIHTGNCRSKLLFRKQTKPNLKKILQGKQISRYAFDWNSPQAKFKYCDIRYIPQNENGIGRGGKMSKAKEYWHFCGAESNHRVDEKILLRQTDDDLIACYINREKDGLFYTDNTLFTVLPKKGYHIFFILGLLNSRLLNVLYHFLSQEQGKSQAQVKTQIVGFLPVPLVDTTRQRPLIDLVTRRLNGELVDDKIDALVYKLYGLTPEEIALVEKQ